MLKFSIINYQELPLVERSRIKKIILENQRENFPSSYWRRSYFEKIICQTDTICFFARKQKAFAGYILGKKNKKNSSAFDLISLLVLSEFRKKGLGKILIRKLLREVGENSSYKKICLHFREKNNLEDFYKKFGFGKKKLADNYKNGDRKYYMENVLR